MLSDSDRRAKQAQAWELVNELAVNAYQTAFNEQAPEGAVFWEYFLQAYSYIDYRLHGGGNVGMAEIASVLGLIFGIDESGPDGYGELVAEFLRRPEEGQA